MHTLKLFRRRFPTGYAVIVVMLFLLTLALLVVGIGMLFVR
jgi:Tfp pilus assembly protein PilX